MSSTFIKELTQYGVKEKDKIFYHEDPLRGFQSLMNLKSSEIVSFFEKFQADESFDTYEVNFKSDFFLKNTVGEDGQNYDLSSFKHPVSWLPLHFSFFDKKMFKKINVGKSLFENENALPRESYSQELSLWLNILFLNSKLKLNSSNQKTFDFFINKSKSILENKTPEEVVNFLQKEHFFLWCSGNPSNAAFQNHTQFLLFQEWTSKFESSSHYGLKNFAEKIFANKTEQNSFLSLWDKTSSKNINNALLFSLSDDESSSSLKNSHLLSRLDPQFKLKLNEPIDLEWSLERANFYLSLIEHRVKKELKRDKARVHCESIYTLIKSFTYLLNHQNHLTFVQKEEFKRLEQKYFNNPQLREGYLQMEVWKPYYQLGGQIQEFYVRESLKNEVGLKQSSPRF